MAQPLPTLAPWEAERPFAAPPGAFAAVAAGLLAGSAPPPGTPPALAAVFHSAAAGRAAATAASPAPPPSIQEALLVEAVLDGLLGTPSRYVAAAPGPAGTGGTAFSLATATTAAFDPGLAALANRVLALATPFTAASAVVADWATPGRPILLQALASASRTVLREYSGLLVQLEGLARRGKAGVEGTVGSAAGDSVALRSRPGLAPPPPPPSTPPPPSLSLQQLWFYLQPSGRTLHALTAILTAVGSTAARVTRGAGGAVLNTLAAFATGRHAGATDADVASALGRHLLEATAAPYLRWLSGWLFLGSLPADDRHNEFLVCAAAADEGKEGEEFALVGETPYFLAPYVTQVLDTGRYLALLKRYGGGGGDAGAAAAAAAAGRGVLPAPSPVARRSGGGGGLIQSATLGSPRASRTAASAGGAASGSVASSRRASGVGAGAGAAGHLLPDAPSMPDAAPTQVTLVSPSAAPLVFSPDPEAYGPPIHAAYSFAAAALLKHFTAPPPVAPSAAAGAAAPLPDVFGRLRTLRAFFCGAAGDWLAGLLDGPATAELLKEASVVSLPRLRAAFELAVRASSCGDEPYRAEVRPTLASSSLLAASQALAAGAGGGTPAPLPSATTGLRGFNTFTLEYTPPPALALVVTPACLARYSALFRLLFTLRFAEAAVQACWSAQQAAKGLSPAAARALTLSNALRHRMLHFLSSLSFYLTVEVVDPAWQAMADSLRGAATLDDVVARHAAFLDAVCERGLLTSPAALALLMRAVSLCLLFASQMGGALASAALPEEELNARAGLTRAAARAAAHARVGLYGGGGGDDDDEDGSGDKEEAGGKGGGVSAAGRAAARERAARAARASLQSAALVASITTSGWQGVMARSATLFDGLVRDLLGALAARGAAASDRRGGGFADLCARLNANGYYGSSSGGAGSAAGAGVVGSDSEGAGL